MASQSIAEKADAEAESTLHRHEVRCSSQQSRNSASRRKSCQQCANDKARCDLARPICFRCQQRRKDCKYLTSDMTQLTQHSLSSVMTYDSSEGLFDSAALDQFPFFSPPGERSGHTSERELEADVECLTLPSSLDSLEPSPLALQLSPGVQMDEQSQQTYHHSPFSNLVGEEKELYRCEIGLSSYGTGRGFFSVPLHPAPHQSVLSLDIESLQFYKSLLETHIRMMSREDMLPPYIHPWQLDGDCPSPALIHCKGLLRMYLTSKSNGEAWRYALESIKMQTDHLLSQQSTYNETELLSSLQALLLYSTAAFFASMDTNQQTRSPFVVDAMFMANLESVALDLSTTGLVTPEETEHTRPSSWDKWILAAAKRRTLLVLYLFTLIFASVNHIPLSTYDKLMYLPGPEARSLWQARDKDAWARAYNRWLVTWENGGPFMFFELLCRANPAFADRSDKTATEERWLSWLAEADEFGMLVLLEIRRAALRCP